MFSCGVSAFRQNSLFLSFCQFVQFIGVFTSFAVSGNWFIGPFSPRGAWPADSGYCLVYKRAPELTAWKVVSSSTPFAVARKKNWFDARL